MNLTSQPFVKYVEIPEVVGTRNLAKAVKGLETRVFEKLDGGLCQIRNIQGQLACGNKANFLTGPVVQKQEWYSRLISWMHSNHGFYGLPEHFVVFGEWLGNHTIQYNPENTDNFFLIDIFDMQKQRFLPYSSAREQVSQMDLLGVRFLDPLHVGQLTPELIDSLLSKGSEFYDGPVEGLVVKDYDSKEQRFFKILSDGFAEQRHNLFGRVDPFTDARIRKAMQRVYDRDGRIHYNNLLQELVADVKKEVHKTYPTPYAAKKIQGYLDRVRREAELTAKLVGFPKQV
jgi:hypothetical protein